MLKLLTEIIHSEMKLGPHLRVMSRPVSPIISHADRLDRKRISHGALGPVTLEGIFIRMVAII
jgi:hypothetical protein